ncbi:MAG: C_GCAxxG_C_C family protein [Clostridia bacterium]|nr:C_GCAxxG_C_C family protein [Clostridia bacterium]
MTKKELAGKYFEDGCNCCQAVLLAFSEEIGLSEKKALMLGSTMGGGICRLREVCGAVSGMEMALGMIEGYSDIKDPQVKIETYEKGQNLAEKFKEENGDIICRNLLSLPEGKDSPIPEKRTEKYYKKRPCKELVESAAGILEEYLKKE